MKRKLLSILITMLMLLSAAPLAAFAESSETCTGGADCKHAASIGNVHYDTLLEAVNAAKNGDTIKLINDYKVETASWTSYVMPENSILDLGGYTLTIEKKGGAVFEGNNITIQNGKFATGNDASYTIWIGNGENDTSATVKNITSDRGANVFVASAVFENCTFDLSAHEEYYAVWGDQGNVKITIKSGTYVGGTEAAVVNANDGYDGSSGEQVSDPAVIKIEGGDFTGKIWVQDRNYGQKGEVVISGGTFDRDVTSYCAEGYIATKGSNDKYIVGKIPEKVGKIDVNENIEKGETEVNVGEGVAESDKDTAEAVASSVTANLNKAAKNITITSDDKKNVVQKLVAAGQVKLDDNGNVVPYDGSTEDVEITIIEETYLEVEVTGLTVNGDTGNELKFDITPKYNLLATTDIQDATKTVTVSTGNTLTVDEDTDVKLQLPEGFALSGDKLLIKHDKSDKTVEYYTGNVSADEDKLYVSFTTNGFSPFTATTEYAASIGEGEAKQVYPSLQAAVDAAKNGDTIKLLKDGEKATVRRTVSFTIDPTKGDTEESYTYTIYLGDGCTRTDTGKVNEWNIVYTAPKSPVTGDNSELGLFAVAGLISAAAVALLLNRKRSM